MRTWQANVKNWTPNAELYLSHRLLQFKTITYVKRNKRNAQAKNASTAPAS